jgi:hypothetical protein
MNEQSNSFFARNWFKLFFVGVTVLIIFIYFEREDRLDSCLSNAIEMHNKWWDAQCTEYKRGEDCKLPTLVAEKVANDYRQLKDDCFRRYSFK